MTPLVDCMKNGEGVEQSGDDRPEEYQQYQWPDDP
jgi:hypothetical protein